MVSCWFTPPVPGDTVPAFVTSLWMVPMPARVPAGLTVTADCRSLFTVSVPALMVVGPI